MYIYLSCERHKLVPVVFLFWTDVLSLILRFCMYTYAGFTAPIPPNLALRLFGTILIPTGTVVLVTGNPQ